MRWTFCHGRWKRLSVFGAVLSAVLSMAGPAAAIGGGTKAAPDEFPWMVRVLPVNCGGTLIHPQLMLTAEHRVDEQPDDSFTIVSGPVDLKSPRRTLTRSTEILGGPDWRDGPDWAVIKLERPLELPTLRIAGLAPAPERHLGAGGHRARRVRLRVGRDPGRHRQLSPMSPTSPGTSGAPPPNCSSADRYGMCHSRLRGRPGIRYPSEARMAR
jgi:hypothetical protein